MRRILSLETSELLISAMDTGSLQQCARLHHLNVSTVSRQLKSLEDAFGLQLFVRDSTGVYPTAAGQNLLGQLRPVVNEISELRAEVTGKPGGFSGSFVAALPRELNEPSFLEIFDEFAHGHPRLTFDFVIGEAGKNLLREPDLELSCARAVPRGFEPVGDAQVALLASFNYLDSRGFPQSPEELVWHDLIVCDPERSVRRIDFYRDDMQVSLPVPSAAARMQARGALMEALHDGGIALGIPRLCSRPLLDSGKLLEVLPEWRMDPFRISAKASDEARKGYFITHFMEHLRETLSRTGGL